MAVENVAYGGPLFLWRGGRYVPLYNAGPVRCGEPHAAGNPCKMGVHNDGGDAEKGGKYHPGGLPADSRKRGEFLHGLRDFAPMAVQKLPGKRGDVAGLSPEKPGGMDQGFNPVRGGFRESRRIGVTGKEGGGNKVHRRVRTLRGQYRGDKELERVCIIKEGFVIRVEGAKDSHDFGKPYSSCRRGFWQGFLIDHTGILSEKKDV
jgi:hypothetical protein